MSTLWRSKPNARQYRSQRTVQPRRNPWKLLRLAGEPLEHRRLLSAGQVTNTNDTGAGSLRQAITDVDAGNATKITFDIPTSDPGFNATTKAWTIAPASSLPTVSVATTVDATSQPGYAGKPLIVLDGNAAGTGAFGLELTVSTITVQGLAIDRFSGAGVKIDNGGDTIQQNFLGTDAGGTTAFSGTNSLGNGVGLEIVGGSASQISNNLISGNLGDGVQFRSTTQNVLAGNFIGTDAAGATSTDAAGNSLGNGLNGVELIAGAANNTIGGLDTASGGSLTGAGNLISGNRSNGVVAVTSNGASNGNLIEGNYVGTDVTGAKALGNALSGIELESDGDTVGGTTTGLGNLISGNLGVGVLVSGSPTPANDVVDGNLIGTDVTGTKSLGNRDGGVSLGAAFKAVVGGTTAAARNVISGNGFDGVDDGGTTDTIEGNYIGSDVSGTKPLGNAHLGVLLNSSTGAVVGGTVGTTPGGALTGAGNLISANGAGGVQGFFGAGTLIEGNDIGTDATGTQPLGNLGDGVHASSKLTVGGTTSAARNVISANQGDGVFVSGAGGLVEGNYIGSDVTGAKALGNGQAKTAGDNYGVDVEAAATLGGVDSTPGTLSAGNLVSGNIGPGVNVGQSGAGATIEGNFIGVDAAGDAPLGNALGLFVLSSATVGDPSSGAGNLISGNLGDGIYLERHDSASVIQGNLIGTDVTGKAGLGNSGSGVNVDGAVQNTIGGEAAGQANTIAFNGADGVRVAGGNFSLSGTENLISANSIFSSGDLGIELLAGVSTNGNNFQPAPVLTSAPINGGQTTVQGTFAAAANTKYTIELFGNPSLDSSGAGEGKDYLGSLTVTTGSSGNAAFSATETLPSGDKFVTSTATDPNGDTSEFSRPLAAGQTPTHLAFTSQPANTTAGQTFSIIVSEEDASNQVVSSAAGDTVTLAIASGPTGATLGGTLRATVSSGVATFNGLSLTTAGQYTLSATDTTTAAIAAATSTTFVISPAAASQLVFTSQPANTTASQAIDAPSGVQVSIEDSFGNVETGDKSNVTIGIASPSGATFAGGTLTEPAVAGVATFKDLVIDTAGTFTLSAADATDSLSGFNSNSFNVSAATATSKLVFTSQPANTTAGQAIDAPSGVQVSIEDSFGNVETGDTSNVTMAIASPSGSTFASGSLSEPAVAGVATFKDLVIDTAGAYTLSTGDATDSLSGFKSNSFNVTAAAASQLVFTAQPTNTTAGQTINGTSGVVVSIEDQFGNVEMGDTSNVTIAIASPSGATFAGGTLSEPAVAGVATFKDLVIDTAGAYTLSTGDATDSLSGFNSNSLNVSAATASQLVFQQQPTSAAIGQAIAPPPTVLIEDAFGNQTTSTANVKIDIQSGPLGAILSGDKTVGPQTVAAFAGLATFSDLSLNEVGNYSFVVTSSGLTGAISNTFAIALPTYTWTGKGPDNVWTDLANWSVAGRTPTVLPGPTDAVIIPATVGNNNFPFVQAGVTATAGSVSDDGLMTLSGELQLPASTTANLTGAGQVNFLEGTLISAHVGASVTLLASTGGTLLGVTLDGTLDVGHASGASIDVQNGLTLGNGALVLIGNASGSNQGKLVFTGDPESLGTFGAATVRLGGGTGNVVEVDTIVTIGAGITIDGQSGVINGAATFTNDGTIAADGGNGTIFPDTGGTMTLDASGWTNEGTIKATGGNNLFLGGGTEGGQAVAWTNAAGATISITGDSFGAGTLTLAGTGPQPPINSNWQNLGTIISDHATLDLGDGLPNEGFTLDALGDFHRLNGGNVVIQSALFGQFVTMTLDGNATNSNGDVMPGSWILGQGGTIVGATIVTRNGAELMGNSQGAFGVLDGVTLVGTLDLSQSSNRINGVNVRDGLTLGDGSLVLIGDAGGGTSGELLFTGPAQQLLAIDDSNHLHVQQAADLHFAATGQSSGNSAGGAASTSLSGVTIRFGANGLNALAAQLDNDAILTIGAGVTMDGQNGTIGSATGQPGGTPFDNQGTIAADGSDGGVPAGGGTLTVNTSKLVNYTNSGFQVNGINVGHLSNGAWTAANGNTLRLLGVAVGDDNAAVTLDGNSSRILSDTGTASALAEMYLIDLGGSLSLLDGARLTTLGSFHNDGSLTLGAGTAGTGPSSLTVTGDYGQFSGGSLTIQIGGPPAGNLFGLLKATGNVVLDGTLNVTLANLFLPAAQTAYQVIDAGAVVNQQFATVNGQPPGQSLIFSPQYNSNNVVLNAQLALQVMEGSSFTLPLAAFDLGSTFTQAQVNREFGATIDWGDGTTSSGQIFAGTQINPGTRTQGIIIANPPPYVGSGATINGTHTYEEIGLFPILVTVKQFGFSAGGHQLIKTILQVPGTAAVADAPLQVFPPPPPSSGASTTANPPISDILFLSPPFATEGQAMSATTQVVHFTDLNPFAKAADFSAVIDWADGSTTAGTVVAAPQAGQAVFAVEGSHTYSEAGRFAVNVTVSEDGTLAHEPVNEQQLTIERNALVVDAPLTFAPVPLNYTGTEGQSLGDLFVASFNDANPLSNGVDFTATIDWGDGQTSAGFVGSGFVTGAHTYLDAGNYNITVTVDDAEGSSVSQVTAQAQIAEQPLEDAAAMLDVVQFLAPAALPNSPFQGPVVYFTDPNLLETGANITATILWGDGSSSSGKVQPTTGLEDSGNFGVPFSIVNVFGDVIPSRGRWFSVSGTHTYGAPSPPGGYPITVEVFDGLNELNLHTSFSVPTLQQLAAGIDNGLQGIRHQPAPRHLLESGPDGRNRLDLRRRHDLPGPAKGRFPGPGASQQQQRRCATCGHLARRCLRAQRDQSAPTSWRHQLRPDGHRARRRRVL
ncbi:MAG TPA: hypothetical protein VMV69_03985 [Pirellulales bacterium]|nr:hypothetical protein [Pirellulales bacterium]